MFENLLRIVCGERVLSTPPSREEESVQERTIEAAPHVTTKAAAICSWDSEDPELRILTENFGELISGRTIEVPLRQLLTLLPRTRRRSDAYRALVKKLERIGVMLNITTNKKGGGYES